MTSEMESAQVSLTAEELRSVAEFKPLATAAEKCAYELAWIEDDRRLAAEDGVR